MGETVLTECPWCGEPLEVWVEGDADGGVTDGAVLQDCDVCCRPCVVMITWAAHGPSVVAQRE